jgi:dTDP-4-dehydrorhamnose 3,5-epimerase
MIRHTPIPGLKLVTISVHTDSRGWFKENWRIDQIFNPGDYFQPVQNNVSFNLNAGVTRGFHAEPWDKYISVSSGKVFGAWIDLRKGDSFGTVFYSEIGPSDAVFIPAGVANAFQSLEANTTYIYLVNGNWDEKAKYLSVSLLDNSLGIPWPISLSNSVMSEKDARNPMLSQIDPFEKVEVLVIGASGQVGKALCQEFPEAQGLHKAQFNLSEASSEPLFSGIKPSWIINAGAYTNVDEAESKLGSNQAWRVNVEGQARLANLCREKGIGLVGFSSDYVFDGTSSAGNSEDSIPSPLNTYGWTKALGDSMVATNSKHYVIRTSWVIGEGRNFVKTMSAKALAGEGVNVVSDQVGRLTFAKDLAHAVKILIDSSAPCGAYNITNSGPLVSWFEIAVFIYRQLGADHSLVTPMTSDEYHLKFPGKAQRPRNSELTMEKFIRNTGHQTPDWQKSLQEFLAVSETVCE